VRKILDTTDAADRGLVRLGVGAGAVLAELLGQAVIDQLMLRGDFGGRLAGDLPADLAALDHRGPEAGLLQQAGGGDPDDAAADDRDVHVDVTRERWEVGGGGGGGPVRLCSTGRGRHR
jgi:hypothetical protein